MWGGGGSYDRWAAFLDQWGAGGNPDPAALPTVDQTEFPADAWERLTNRMTAALSQRLTTWAAALTRAIGEARDEFGVGRALAQARTGLATVRSIAGHPGLPGDLTARLVELVDRQISTAQRNLEDEVERMRRGGADRSAVEARLRTIRDNPLTGGAAPTLWQVDVPAAGRRRIIIDPSA